MDDKKIIRLEEIQMLADKTKFNERFLTKDYFITRIIYCLRDVKNIYFKGGTAIQKTILSHSRLSEDIDFTVTSDLKAVEDVIISVLSKEDFVIKIEKDKSVDGFTRLVVHYNNLRGQNDTIFIDLNGRAKLCLKPENSNIKHFYREFIPSFSANTLNHAEMIAEKMAAAIGRNKPRDHYDLYKIIKAGYTIDIELVKKKCGQSGCEFDILKMFNKAKKLKRRWGEDMLSLLPDEEITFQEVITIMAKHFSLKQEKEKVKTK